MFVLHAAHTWTEARFVPRFRSQPDQICMSSFTFRQLINFVHEELFSTFPLGRSLLLIPRLQVALDFLPCYSVVEPSLADASSSSGSNFVVRLCSFRRGELVTLGDVPSDRCTRDANFFGCGDAVAPSSTTASTAHSQYCLSLAHTHTLTRTSSLGIVRSAGFACRSGFSLRLYLIDLHCQLWFRLVSRQRNAERLAHVSQLGLVLLIRSDCRSSLTSSPSPRVRARCSSFREECMPRSQLVPIPVVPVVPSLRLARCE